MTKLLRILFVMLFAAVWTVGGAQTVETIWEEDWTGGKNNQVPSEFNSIYSSENADVHIVTGNTAGGVAPELVVAQGGVFSVNVSDLKGCTNFTLTFNTNRGNAITIKANDEVVKYTCNGKNATATFSVDASTTSLKLSFNYDANGMRLDNFKLTGTKVVPTSVSFGDFDASKTYFFVDGELGDFVAPAAVCTTEGAKGSMEYSTSKPNMVTIDKSTGSFTFSNNVYGYAYIYAQWIGSDGYANSEKVQYQVSNRKTLVFNESDAENLNDVNNYGLANVTLNRALYADGWNTLCVPFNINANNIAAQFGEGTKLMELDSEEGNVLKFKEATAVKAGCPYLIKPAKDGTAYELKGVAVDGTAPTEVGNTVKFKGLYHEADITADGNVAGIASGNKVVTVKAGGSTKAFRAYFVLPASHNAASYVLDLGGNATAIGKIYNGSENASSPIYNLQGQRMDGSRLPSGIYVQNGRKFVVK